MAPMSFWRAVTWVAILAPLPYGISRLLWAFGVPVGISADVLRDELDSPGMGSLALLLLVALTEGTALFTHAFVLTRTRTIPRWVPWLRGRPVRPWWVIGPLLAPIAILAAASIQSVGLVLGLVEDGQDLPAWSLWGQVTVFMVWGAALTAATFAYWRATVGPDGAGPTAGQI